MHQSSVLSTEASRLKLAKDFASELESKLCEAELDAGKCPLIVRRTYPDHSAEDPHFEDIPVASMRLW